MDLYGNINKTGSGYSEEFRLIKRFNRMLEAKNVGTVVVMIMDRCEYWDAKVEKGNNII